MKPLVFLGSGVSLPTFGDAGSLANLTEALFEEPWARTTSGTWLAKEPSPTDEKPPCQEFLLRMRKRVEDYYFDQRGSRPNYEDLFYLIEQIDDELAWRGNASVEPFREKVKSLCADLCERRKSQYDDPLRSLTEKTLIFIQHVIAHKLHTNCPPVGFELLKGLANLQEIYPLTVCTLNHDLLVERFFKREDVEYTDGFLRTPVNGIRYFDRTEFQNENIKVRLLKLHGSIDWWRIRPVQGGFSDERIGIRVLPPDECRSVSGQRLSTMDSHPRFLTGSHNKIADYQAGIFLAQMREFDRALDEHDLIVMSGYGWGDNGINRRLKSWIWEKDGRQIIVLHKDRDQLRQFKPLLHSFVIMSENRKLISVQKWLCEVEVEGFCRCLKRRIYR